MFDRVLKQFLPANIYLFKVNNKNTRKSCEKFKVNNKNTRTTSRTSFWCFYCSLWTYFTTFSGVFIVDFKQVNVGWADVCLAKYYLRSWLYFAKRSERHGAPVLIWNHLKIIGQRSSPSSLQTQVFFTI